MVLSTDKAVYPINAMGISKALNEKVMVAKPLARDTKQGSLKQAAMDFRRFFVTLKYENHKKQTT